MARTDLLALTQWITVEAVRAPDDVLGAVMRRTGLGRATARKWLHRLVDIGWLTDTGSPRRPRHRPGVLRQVVRSYTLDGIVEDQAWAVDFAPCFELPLEVMRMMQHAFTELLNNAADHSGGSQVTVSLRQTPSQVQLLVSDDGCGLFDQLCRHFDLPDAASAMMELDKGRLTSQPERHGGRGLFFTSRLADVFDVHANQAAFQRRAWEPGIVAGRPLARRGTSVYAAISLDTTRTLKGVLASHSRDGKSFRLERTRVALSLVTSDINGLATRSQARRVAARLRDFQRAEIDFHGVTEIGHSFADELFRVQAREGLSLVPINMTPAVVAMIASIDN